MIATLGLTISAGGLATAFALGCGAVRAWFLKGEEKRYGNW